MEIESQENGISLLDLLLVVAEHLKLLILGPLLVGLVALGVSYAVPQSFTSQAIVALPTPTPTPTQAAAIMLSPLVLDPVIQARSLSAGQSMEAARAKLAKQLKTTVGKDGLLRLDATAPTPLEAQALANAILDTWLKSTVPGVQERADLEKRLAYAKVSLESVHRLLERLTAEELRKPLTRGDAGSSIVAVGELQARYQNEVLGLSRALLGVSRDVVVQMPTLPTDPVAPKKSLIAVLAALGSGFALLLGVFLRQAWRRAAQDPAAAGKQARLCAALGFGGRTG